MFKRGYRNLGILFLVGSIFTSFNVTEITGNVIGSSAVSEFLSIFLFCFGLFSLVVATRVAPLEVVISEQALDRLKKDKFVRENRKQFHREINMISQSPEARPQERLGNFKVSPRGGSSNGIRVAWNLDPVSGQLRIYDLLYHKSNERYVDGWNDKARLRTIQPGDYDGFRRFSGF
jgi:hypothetical protein